MEYYINKIKKDIEKYFENGKFKIDKLIAFTTDKVEINIYGTKSISDEPILKLISLKKKFGLTMKQLTYDMTSLYNNNMYILNGLFHILVGFYAKTTCSFTLNIGKEYSFPYTVFPEQLLMTFDNIYPLLLYLCIYQEITITFLSGNINDLYLLTGSLVSPSKYALMNHDLISHNKVVSYNSGYFVLHNMKRESNEYKCFDRNITSKRQCLN